MHEKSRTEIRAISKNGDSFPYRESSDKMLDRFVVKALRFVNTDFHRNPNHVFTLQDTFCPGFIFEVDKNFNVFITR